jgi:peptide/nickel transport system permease protein
MRMGQRAHIVRRVLQMIPTIMVLVILVFFMIRLIPGDPAVTMLGVNATPDRVKELHEHLGLDKPLIVQLVIFVGNLARGDLGNSLLVRVPVIDLVKQRLPLTLFLVAYAMLLALLMTLPLALLSVIKRGSIIDQFVRGFSMTMIATPGFWIGILLLILLGVKVHLFPVGGAGTSPRDWPYHLFLPALTLALHVAAVLTRNLRDSLLTMMQSEHVLVARAKGLGARGVMLGHVLRNAMISTVTLFGLYVGYLVGGSVIIESVFALPGMGSMIVQAILGRDYQVVQGFTLIYAILVSVVYLLTDIAYSFVDPRVSLS